MLFHGCRFRNKSITVKTKRKKEPEAVRIFFSYGISNFENYCDILLVINATEPKDKLTNFSLIKQSILNF